MDFVKHSLVLESLHALIYVTNFANTKMNICMCWHHRNNMTMCLHNDFSYKYLNQGICMNTWSAICHLSLAIFADTHNSILIFYNGQSSVSFAIWSVLQEGTYQSLLTPGVSSEISFFSVAGENLLALSGRPDWYCMFTHSVISIY